MSNFQYQCCCSEEACDECPSSSCPCNTSYAVNGIDFSYQFIYGSPDIPCTYCNTGCYRKEYSITLQFQQTAAATVTRRTCPENGKCGWYGTLDLECTYTVELLEQGKCFSTTGLNRTKSQTFTGTVTVDACIHVTCRGCATHEGCAGFLVSNERAYHHTLEICDFPIKCTDVELLGGYALPSGPCECGADCDWDAANYAPCDCGPFSLRCIGGTLSFLSKYKCLSTLVAADYRCRGWYNPLRCELPCTGTVSTNPTVSTLDQNVASCGVFAVVVDSECSEQDAGDDGYCDQKTRTSAFLPTNGAPFDAGIQEALQSYCGSVDDVMLVTSCAPYEYTVFQIGCPNPWTYA